MNENQKRLLLIGGGILIVVIVGIVLFSLAGGKKDNNTQQTKTTLVYWGLWEPDSAMQSLIDKYEKQNTNVEIQYVQKPFTQYEANLYTRIQQNTIDNTPIPDIVRVNNAWRSKFESLLAPMPDSVMSAATYSSTFYPTALKDFTGSDGYIYAVPLEIDGLTLFYNKKLFNSAGYSEAPTDWDAFIEYAKKMTKKDTNGVITQAGAALGTSKNIKHSADILNLLFLQNAVDIISADGKTVTLSSTRAQSALDFYTAFTTEHQTWSTDLATDLETFYSGKLAMMLAPSWRAFDIINSAPNIEFGLAPVPQLPGNDPVNYAMYWGEAVPKTSPNQAEAWKFIKFLSEPEQMKEMFSNSSQVRAFGEPYSRKDLASEMGSNPYVNPILKMASTMKAWQMGEQGYVEESLRTAINDVIASDTPSDQALREAEERINLKLQEVLK
ncbi:MAG: Multiple sugar transport system substrate-binding protein [candidate division WS6 bacterium GW2011_GWF2_39_15]|uniref:Multiple sugar transport system substrate-binding protein n=1 Tax=candidate division WS6 bacterium GW2011_GWF2_39_15 TaxID=1619100 RepID=A0A0G0MYK9_9BACT|nr:MAG: Multiple sugar transport system substrate-binding protein [candidate division WS6 bacterium GW2011_GWF2_39_15]